MKKSLLFAVLLMAGTMAQAETESYVATTTTITRTTNDDGTETVTAATEMAPEFANAVIADGKSEINFGTANMAVYAIGGTTPKDVEETEAGVFPGWQEWNSVSWSGKNQNIDDHKTIYFGYVLGTGNPCTAIEPEAVMTDGVATGMWRAKYTYYQADGSTGLPVQGLYYKFTPKKDGVLKLMVWSNKGNRNTFVVDSETMLPVEYTVEGYINGQNEPLEDGTNTKKYLSNEEIQALHDNAKCQKDENGEIIPDTDSAPYVIGAGNQNFWGYLFVNVVAGKSYLLFQDSSQIGFGGYEFTTEESGNVDPQPTETYDYLTLTFAEKADSYSDGNFSLTLTDEAGKITVDENSANFGTPADYTTYTTRLKTGGKSSSKNMMTLSIPTAGKLQIMARTASNSATDRNVVVTQNEVDVLDHIMLESEAVTVGADTDSPDKIYPIVEADVVAGEATITYPVGAINFYCIRLAVPQGAGIDAVESEIRDNAIYNIRGQRVSEMTAGQIYIVNGRKVVVR